MCVYVYLYMHMYEKISINDILLWLKISSLTKEFLEGLGTGRGPGPGRGADPKAESRAARKALEKSCLGVYGFIGV